MPDTMYSREHVVDGHARKKTVSDIIRGCITAPLKRPTGAKLSRHILSGVWKEGVLAYAAIHSALPVVATTERTAFKAISDTSIGK